MPQFFLLMHLRHHEHCGISDLSEHMEITNAAASQLVDKLVQAGLLVRVEDPYRTSPPLMKGMYVKAVIPGRVVEDVVVLPRQLVRTCLRRYIRISKY